MQSTIFSEFTTNPREVTTPQIITRTLPTFFNQPAITYKYLEYQWKTIVAPAFSVSDAAPVQEPATGSISTSFTVTLDTPLTYAVSINYATKDNTLASISSGVPPRVAEGASMTA
jgi:hypothetical protein